jgi:inorganic triphosphatase YgiF
MTHPATETELKLAVEATDLRRLLRLPWLRGLQCGRVRRRRLTATYYDTADAALWARGITVRLRGAQGGPTVQTVKTAPPTDGVTGVFSRLEWEIEAPDGRLDLSGAAAAGLPPDQARLLADPAALHARCTTDVRRTELTLSDGHWTVLLALDRGMIRAGEDSAPLSEVEIEAVTAETADLWALAARLARDIPVRLEPRSKAARGFDLAAGRAKAPPAPVKGKTPALSRDMTAGTAFRAIGTACLVQMAANQRPLLEGDDPEAVHQMRVATRRLRSAMTLFRPVVAGADMDAVRADLRWLMAALGPARDADVFLMDILDPVRDALPEHAGLTALRRVFAARRDRARTAARAAVGDPRFTRLLLELGAWIEGGDWVRAAGRPLRDRRVAHVACDRLNRRWRTVSKGLARFDSLSETERHDLRIQIKKMRYATEFFGSLFEAKSVSRFRAALATAQDQLGALNDVAVADALLYGSVTDASGSPDADRTCPEYAWAAGLVAGWHQRAARETLASTGRTVTRLADLPRFWT